ncbi:glutathione S-transferase [Schizopora paradoxa]|uniref:glutathione transferase n=1 Tax=Schizopora paradoxa TaxID=27342 RepID=A0A0H2RSH1_9AGAM|nr:glutathione S-transferase [Schizopora paradoxa]
MVLKLYGPTVATCTQRVLVVARHLGIPLEVINVDLPKGEHLLPEYLEKQPFGQVPLLDDDGFLVFEGRAIARYLSAEYADGKLIPKGAKENAIFEQAAAVESANFDPFARALADERFFKSLFGGAEPDETVASEQQAKLEAKLDAYEVILARYKYLGGNELTLADLFHLPYGAVISTPASPGAPFVNLEDPKRPNVARWWREISCLPAWKAVSTEAKEVLAAMKRA